MENINRNIPIFNFIYSSLKEKNNEIKEKILLGNIHFPSKIQYTTQKNKLQLDNHKLFINNLSNKISLIKIQEEKSFLNNKIEITHNKINNLKKNFNSSNNTIKKIYNRYNNKNNNNDYKTIPKSISNVDNMNSLPLLSDRRRHKLIEIKPIVHKKYISKNKIMNNDYENDLEQNAKEFVKRINNSKMNNLSLRKQKQEKDYLRLKKQIEIMEKKRKMREDFEFQRKYGEKVDDSKKKNINININKIKFPNKKYHYFNKNKNKILVKNLTEELSDFNSQLYYNYPNPYINQYKQLFNTNNISNNNINEIVDYKKKMITDVNRPIINETKNKSKILPEASLNVSNETGTNNNSLLNTSEKKHLYYFNELKYRK